jgi:hypothetical protein
MLSRKKIHAKPEREWIRLRELRGDRLRIGKAKSREAEDEPQVNPPPLRYGATGYRFAQINSQKITARQRAATKSWWNAVGLGKSGV